VELKWDFLLFVFTSIASTLLIEGVFGVQHLHDTDTCDYIQLCHIGCLCFI